MPDIILEGDHPRIISAKFGWDWLSSFRGEDFFFISSPFFLFLAWWPSWLEVRITWHNFGRSSKEHSTKVWLQLAQWFLRKVFLCEFPIGSYVKLSSPDTFLEEIQWLFHQNLVLIQQSLVEIGSVVSEEKIFFKFHPFFLICIIGKSSKFIKNPIIYVKKLIIMLMQFKFGHILA